MSKLVIVESPSKIPTIKKCLGNDYIIMASCGHIIDLDHNWKPKVDDYEPKYSPTKEDVIKKLKKSCKNISKDNVYLATDKDREGEMIAWSLAKELKVKNAKRIIFTSITKKEIVNAINSPSIINMNVVYSQQTRRLIDRSTGFTVSPILLNNVDNAKSAGRVQSVVVKIIVDKENEINDYYNSKKSTFYYINSNIKINEFEIIFKLMLSNEETSDKSDGSNKSPDKKLIFDKSDEKKVLKIIKRMAKSKFNLFDVSSKEKLQNPSEPFTTSTLQQVATSQLNINSKLVMSIAQKLYEGGHITYMRTDSISISDEGLEKIKSEIIKKFGDNYYRRKVYEKKNDNTQEAHECIRPTKMEVDNLNLSDLENKLYRLIWKRTMQSQMSPAKYQSIKMEVEMLNQEKLDDYKLVGCIENLIFNGYLILDNKNSNEEIDLDTFKGKINWIKIYATEDIKNQPPRYNEASLVKKLDPKNLNIGRPSTYASLMTTIVDRKYVEIKEIKGSVINTNIFTINKNDIETVETTIKGISIGKEKNKFVPTELGLNATEFLNKNFELFMDYKFTSKMEKNLDKIADGKKDKKDILVDFLQYLQEKEDTLKINKKEFKQEENIIGKIDNNDVNLLKGKHGHYVSFNDKKMSVEELFENDKKPKNKDILKYIKENIPQEIGTIDGNNIEVKISKKGRKYVYINDTYIDLNDLYEKDDITNKVVLKYVKDFLNKNISLEWKIKKDIYKLKNGQYGYYLEEYKNKKKSRNISLYNLINKLKEENNCDDIEAVKKITNNDIQEII